MKTEYDQWFEDDYQPQVYVEVVDKVIGRAEALRWRTDEIAWCESHRGLSGRSTEFEDGFIEGLRQAVDFGTLPLIAIDGVSQDKDLWPDLL